MHSENQNSSQICDQTFDSNNSRDLSFSSNDYNSVESIDILSNKMSNVFLSNNELNESNLSSTPVNSSGKVRKVYSFSANSSPSLYRKNLSENGNIIWDEDQHWIQLYDKMLRLNGRAHSFRQYRSCGCRPVEGGFDSLDAKPILGKRMGISGDDEVDFKINLLKPTAKRAMSAPPVKRNALTASKVSADPNSKTGAADEEMFMNSFEDVPRVMIFSSKDLEREINKFKETCSDPSIHWEKRVEALKRLRSLLIAGAADFDEFITYLKPLELSFQVSVKDLRSKVVREACITIAYLSQRLGIRCDRFAEALLPTLINLIQNSAKIMSSSAVVAIRFLIQSTHASRLIPVITYNISSKSKEIRKSCCEFLDQLLHTWPNHALEKHVGILQEAIKKAISDADPEARAYARKAFWGFADKFKKEANYLLNSLDSNKQRILNGENNSISNWSSTNSLNKAPQQRPQSLRTNSVSSSGSIENINRQFGGSSKSRQGSGIPIFSPRNETAARVVMPSPFRTTSAIDPGAQRRARARAAYSAALSQPKVVPISYSVPRTTPKRVDPSTLTSPERSRTKCRVSKSQPGSRSGSPSRFNFGSMQTTTDSRGHRVRRKSGIPTSSTSRDSSPNRSNAAYSSMERRLSSGGRNRSYVPNTPNERVTPLMAEKILLQSQEAEAALQDALITRGDVTDSQVTSARKRYNNLYDDHSDESETSSSYGARKMEDVSDIIHNLSSTHWSDRKEGLQSLALLFRDSTRVLNPYELKRITDIFTKMLLDPHTKTFTLFLGILNDLIQLYKNELNSWLYILMTRLFLKIGSDTLGSIQSRILKTFELIRDSFSSEEQFVVIIRFLSDQTQTPNVKVKTAVLQYLINLIPLMDSNDINFNSRNNHEIQLSLMKIISWTADPKSSELRRISQDVIVDLYNLNCADMSLIINALPKTYEDAALQIIHNKRRTRNESPAFSPMSGLSSLRTPSVIKHSSQAFNKLSLYDETENLNPDEIYNSLRKTTDEIQKYSFNIDSETIITSISSNNHNSNNNQAMSPTISPKKTVLGRNFKDMSSASQDSGISQLDGTTIAQNSRTPISSPVKQNICETSIYPQNGNHSYAECENSSYFNTVLIGLRSNTKDTESQKECLNDLIELIREGSSDEWALKFKEVYKILLDKITEQSNSAVRAMSLRVMCELLMKRTKYFPEYIELTILRILESSKDSEKEVVRAAEGAAGTAAAVLPPEQCLKILKSVIKTGESPMNIAAIKMLTKLIELQPKHIVMDLLPEMMPALLQAYDNPESAVRKAAVFCMVSIHGVVGEAMNPYLSSLNGSKMKLLKLYIERAKSQSGNSSPLLAHNS